VLLLTTFLQDRNLYSIVLGYTQLELTCARIQCKWKLTAESVISCTHDKIKYPMRTRSNLSQINGGEGGGGAENLHVFTWDTTDLTLVKATSLN
jgi:hypothetical protein